MTPGPSFGGDLCVLVFEIPKYLITAPPLSRSGIARYLQYLRSSRWITQIVTLKCVAPRVAAAVNAGTAQQWEETSASGTRSHSTYPGVPVSGFIDVMNLFSLHDASAASKYLSARTCVFVLK